MSAQDLYDRIKAALDFFGLKFSDMDEIKVEFDDCSITFSHRNRKITEELN